MTPNCCSSKGWPGELRDLAGAEACLRRLVGEAGEGAHFASVDAALRGAKGRHNLAVVLREQGRAAEAEAEWRRALEFDPAFVLAWLELGELALGQGRRDMFDAALARLEDLGAAEAAALRRPAHPGDG
jgi:tetratricopeptide (TPR) repeat protein